MGQLYWSYAEVKLKTKKLYIYNTEVVQLKEMKKGRRQKRHKRRIIKSEFFSINCIKFIKFKIQNDELFRNSSTLIHTVYLLLTKYSLILN